MHIQLWKKIKNKCLKLFFYFHVRLQEVRKDKIFLTLPTFDHIAVIDVASFLDIPVSWPTFLWSISNQLLNDIYFGIPLLFFFAGVTNCRSCNVFGHFCNYKFCFGSWELQYIKSAQQNLIKTPHNEPLRIVNVQFAVTRKT
jgi:hypothetical protein